MTTALLQERRRAPRLHSGSVEVAVRSADRSLPAETVNVSEGGLCVRLQELLEIRSLIHLHLGGVECAGRVAWVIQRLDLRPAPPFMFDVGVEFIDPPRLLRRWLAERFPSHPAASAVKAGGENAKGGLQPWVFSGRTYMPSMQRASRRPQPWHLVVAIDGSPCFSGHYASERQALAAWAAFKRAHAKRGGPIG
ncbi:MAG: PilZ domain-containing protein [Candidatus Omnitrophica bacterium]|nr:PilZ domain-containing protein [Candidatus Omnitrophota bacterium]